MTVRKNSVDESQKALNAFLDRTEVNGMSCNTSKCKELCMAKKGVTPDFPPLCGIDQSDSFTLLGVTLQNDCKFSSHVRESFGKQTSVCKFYDHEEKMDKGRYRSSLLRLLFCQRSHAHFQYMEPAK